MRSTNTGKNSYVQSRHHGSKMSRFIVTVMLFTGTFLVGWGFGTGRISVSVPSRIQSRNQALPENLDYASVEQVYDALKQNYDGELTAEVLLNGLKNGLADATNDPYTQYLDKAAAKEFDEDLNQSFSGIGAELNKEDNHIVVQSPVPGYPAEKAGLRARDIITEIDEKPTLNMSLKQAVDSIRGTAGTNVKLVINRQGKEVAFNITRQNISIPSVESKILEGNIGYMKITTFSGDVGDKDGTAKLAQKVAEDFKQKKVAGVILDVRGNPGGLLDSSVKVSSLWLDSGDVVLTEKRGGRVIKTYQASGKSLLSGVPTIVLIDSGSASASEIVAGALKDNKVATLLGMNSYGKGSVQNLNKIPSGGVLKVTIGRWYTPNGLNIDKEGISPDRKVDLSEADFKAKRDPQLDSAVKSLQ